MIKLSVKAADQQSINNRLTEKIRQRVEQLYKESEHNDFGKSIRVTAINVGGDLQFSIDISKAKKGLTSTITKNSFLNTVGEQDFRNTQQFTTEEDLINSIFEKIIDELPEMMDSVNSEL